MESQAQFPKWLYGPKGEREIVQNPEQEAAKLAAGWKDTPAAFEKHTAEEPQPAVAAPPDPEQETEAAPTEKPAERRPRR